MDIGQLIQHVIRYADDAGATGDPCPTEVTGLSIVRQRTPTPFTPTLYHPLLCVVLQGVKQSSYGGRTVTFCAMQSLIVSIALPAQSRVVQASVQEPYVALALELNLGLLRELASLTGTVVDEDERGDAISAGPANPELLTAIGRLFCLTKKPQAINILAPLIIREVHYWLLAAYNGAMLRHLLNLDAHASRIARSIVTIQRDYRTQIRVVELARVAGMSVSGFHDHFKAITATTPLQFQKQIRLVTARQMLLTGQHSVSDAAYEVGYESSTQFSRDYSRAFGTPPSHTRQPPKSEFRKHDSAMIAP